MVCEPVLTAGIGAMALPALAAQARLLRPRLVPALSRGAALDPRIEKLVASVSEERLQQLLAEALELRDAQHAVGPRPRRTASARRGSGSSTS